MKHLGKQFLISGASMGLGAEIARNVVKQGASVMICSRNIVELSNIATELKLLAHPEAKIFHTCCDISKETDVDALKETTMELFPNLYALVNNAGIYGPFGPIEENDWESWKQAIAINLVGTIYLTRSFVPHLKAQKMGKIVAISGGGATSPMPMVSSYAASKAGVIRFFESLAGELKEFNIGVNAIAPGVLKTRMTDALLSSRPESIGKDFHARVAQMEKDGQKTLLRAADLASYLSSSDSDGITGRLISAIWDPWEDFENLKDKISKTDIYTIRRITPQDRGEDWEA
jgi:3-oxoacyl-[acyl-carrier protein] reductase